MKESYKHPLRSAVCTEGRRMAGSRALWVATGMKHEQFGKPIIAIVNSFTQFVPGHTHLHEIGQIVREEIEKMGCYAAEFNTIAIDDGIAMGHDGMLYSLPSRDIIADSVEYMVNAHKADAMICISNCDKVTPGMLMASMRLNIPTVFCSGGPMEAGKWRGENADLITAMVKGADPSVTDEEMQELMTEGIADGIDDYMADHPAKERKDTERAGRTGRPSEDGAASGTGSTAAEETAAALSPEMGRLEDDLRDMIGEKSGSGATPSGAAGRTGGPGTP